MRYTGRIAGFCIAFILLPAFTIAQTATIDLAAKDQYIRGFGGMNMPGWIPDLTAVQANKAFGVGDGMIGLSVLRIRISPDPNYFYMEYPTVQRARSFGVTVYATPWSPPAYMKSNNSTIKGYLKPQYYGAFAKYLKSFADYMNNKDAPLYALSLQNEPDWLPDYESCGWTSSQFVNFLRGYGSAVENNLIVAESFHFDHSLTDPVLNDSVACSKISVIGGHIYGSGLEAYPLAREKGEEIWMTEHYSDTDSANIWSGAMKMGKEINDCMNAGFSVYTWWYIRRYYGLIDDNSNITKRGYVMSQFSRFIRPGFTRVNVTTGSAANIDVTAYKKENNVVIIALNRNSGTSTVAFSLQNGSVSSLTRYTTSAIKNVVLDSTFTVSGDFFSASLDPQSITTFIYRDGLNMIPDANAGTDRIITDSDNSGSESITLNASGSTDADGKILSYLWSENGDTIATGITPTIDFSTGFHHISLTVTDDSSAIATDSLNVLVNIPPVADAGPDQAVMDTNYNGNEPVILDGSGSSDTDGTILSYAWSENGSTIATGVNPAINLAVGMHTIMLTVTDDNNGKATDTVMITVHGHPNFTPVADAGSDMVVADTNNSGGETVMLDGSGSSDQDGTIVSYIWSEKGNQIATGVQPSVDLSLGVHTISLAVTDDSSATATDTVMITIQQHPNYTPFADAGPDQVVTDSSGSGSITVTLDGTGSNDIDGTIVSYVWNENSNQIATGVQPSLDLVQGVHAISLVVTDDSSATATDTVMITVNRPSGLNQLRNSPDEVIIYPNPFSDRTTLKFTLATTANVAVVITDITGRKVKSLNKGIYPAGTCRITFNGSDLKRGIYFCRVITGNTYSTVKMTVNR